MFVVNKADRPGRDATVRDLHTMLSWSSARDWTPPVIETVASEGRGVDELWAAITAHRAHLEADDRLPARRAARMRRGAARPSRPSSVNASAAVCEGPSFDALVTRVVDRTVDPYTAVTSLLDASEPELISWREGRCGVTDEPARGLPPDRGAVIELRW